MAEQFAAADNTGLRGVFGRVTFTALLAMALAMPAMAQTKTDNRVAANTDWSVFVEDSPKECWSVSAPKETVNTRDGRVVPVRRSELLLFVFYRPEAGVTGQVTFTGGYPFARGSKVELEIGTQRFALDTDGEWAWPSSPDEDQRIVAAMKAGSDAVLTARSTRGTVTKDTFSLLGFTAANDDAAARCK